MIHITNRQITQISNTAVTLGNFDGMHLGHRKLINEMKDYSKKNGLTSVVFSFSPHPIMVLKDENFKTILSPEENKYIAGSLGVDILVSYPFDKEFSAVSPEAFIKNVIIEQLKCKRLFVGEGFRFGAGRAGTPETIMNIGAKLGMEVTVVPYLCEVDENADFVKISSSSIRKLIEDRDFTRAEKLLSYPYFIMGKTQRGKKIGRSIGFPTVNIVPDCSKLIPSNGVYITKTKYKGGICDSITNIGTNPTVAGKHKTVESFLFDFNGEIYEEEVCVCFYGWLRDEMKFPSVEGLAAQIREDVVKAKVFHYKERLK